MVEIFVRMFFFLMQVCLNLSTSMLHHSRLISLSCSCTIFLHVLIPSIVCVNFLTIPHLQHSQSQYVYICTYIQGIAQQTQ